ncbi:MAG TPA: hypothetical protein VI670_16345 [Thermoanaerobaculia bacterium]|jgi:WD40 repeat protein
MKHDAFISYRRSEGSGVAQRLRNALRNYRLPKPLRTDERRLSIYLDTVFERADTDFFEKTIKPALQESRYLIVIMTPHILDQVEGSSWVMREIEYFRTLPQGNNIIFATASEEWTTVVPSQLGASPQAEVIDLRGYRGIFRGGARPVRDEILKLVATLFDIPSERMPDLHREDERQRLSRARRLIGTLAVIIVLLAVLLYYALKQRNAAREELATAHVLNARMNADNGDVSASLLWIAAASRLHEGDADAGRVDRIRFTAALQASPQLLDVRPEAAATVLLDLAGSRWIAYGESIDMYETATGRRLFHLDTAASAAAFDKSGRKVATASGSVARVWDAANGRPLAPPIDQKVAVESVTLRPDGSELAVETDDDGVHIWNLTTSPEGATHRLHLADATRIDYDNDGRRMLTYDGGPAIHVRDAQAGSDLLVIQSPSDVVSARFSSDGRMIVTGSADKRARLWDAATGAAIGTPTEPVDTSASVRFSGDGSKIVVYGSDVVLLVDARTGHALAAPLPNVHAVTSALFTDDSRFLLTLGDGMLRAWDAATGRPVAWVLRLYARDFDVAGNFVVAVGAHDMRLWKFDFAGGVISTSAADQDWILVRFSDAAPRFVTASYDGPVRIWQIEHGRPRVIWSLPGVPKLRSVAIDREGARIITGALNGQVSLWSISRSTPLFTVTHKDSVGAIQFSPDGRRFATASWDGTGRVWSAADGRPITPPLTHRSRLFSIRFSQDGREVITASEDGSARVWNASTGVRRLTLPHRQANYAEFSADARRIVTAALNGRWQSDIRPGSAIVWDAVSGDYLFTLRHADNVLHATFSPDGKRIATVSLDRTARIWDAADGRPLTPPLQHADRLWFVRFAPDGRLAVTTCYDGTARVWDTETGLPVTPVLWHRNGVWSADFSADSRWLVTTSRRGEVHLHDLAPDQRPLDVLDAVARITSQQRLVPGGGVFPLEQNQFMLDRALVGVDRPNPLTP